MNDKDKCKQGEVVDTYNDNFLYFIDRVKEMLFHYTPELFRGQTLNTKDLAGEYLDVLRDAKNDRFPESRTLPVLEELYTSYISDEAAKSLVPKGQLRDKIKRHLEKPSNDTEKLVQYLCNLLNGQNYYNALTNCLKEAISEKKPKSSVETVARNFVAELANQGYSHEYVYYIVNGLSRRIPTQESAMNGLGRFLESFSLKKKMFSVTYAFRAAKNQDQLIIASLRELLVVGDAKSQADDDGYMSDEDKLKELCAKNACESGQSELITLFVEDRDAYSAANQASRLFKLAVAPFCLLVNDNPKLIFKKCLVEEQGKSPAFPNYDGGDQKLLQPNIDDVDEAQAIREKAKGALLLTMTSLESPQEVKCLIRSVELHNSSIAIEEDDQSSFLCLWMALEVLCRDANQVINLVTWVMERRYYASFFDYLQSSIRGQFAELYKDLFEGHGSFVSRLGEILRNQGGAEYTKLWEALRGSPLICSRLEILLKLIQDKKAAKQILREYGKQIRWHMERMRRTRNGIVHMGLCPKRIQTLSNHLHIYCDAVMELLFAKLGTRRFASIKEILFAIEIEHKNYVEGLNDLYGGRDFSILLP